MGLHLAPYDAPIYDSQSYLTATPDGRVHGSIADLSNLIATYVVYDPNAKEDTANKAEMNCHGAPVVALHVITSDIHELKKIMVNQIVRARCDGGDEAIVDHYNQFGKPSLVFTKAGWERFIDLQERGLLLSDRACNQKNDLDRTRHSRYRYAKIDYQRYYTNRDHTIIDNSSYNVDAISIVRKELKKNGITTKNVADYYKAAFNMFEIPSVMQRAVVDLYRTSFGLAENRSIVFLSRALSEGVIRINDR